VGWEGKATISNGREPKSCLGQDFNSKLGCIGIFHGKFMTQKLSLLELKTRSRFRPVTQSLEQHEPQNRMFNGNTYLSTLVLVLLDNNIKQNYNK